jgi:putative SOS response-associated peptidase YedK
MTWEELVRYYRLTLDQPPPNTQARYNICPTDPVDTIVLEGAKRQLISMRWGLIPNWWNKPLTEMKQATFNARAETVATKPFFRDAFNQKRCLIPASGYYEWLSTPTAKQPYYFTRRDGQPLTFTGLWDEWHEHATNTLLKSCSMVITKANSFVADIHDRMPVILEPTDFEQWEHGDPSDAAQLMRPAAENILQRWPVSRRVNSSKAPTDDPSLTEADLQGTGARQALGGTLL